MSYMSPVSASNAAAMNSAAMNSAVNMAAYFTKPPYQATPNALSGFPTPAANFISPNIYAPLDCQGLGWNGQPTPR